MKKIVMMILMSILISSCGSSKRIDGREYECYGFFDKAEIKQDNINYKFVTMNLFPGIIFGETIVAPLLIFGFQSHCPTDKVKDEINSNITITD